MDWTKLAGSVLGTHALLWVALSSPRTVRYDLALVRVHIDQAKFSSISVESVSRIINIWKWLYRVPRTAPVLTRLHSSTRVPAELVPVRVWRRLGPLTPPLKALEEHCQNGNRAFGSARKFMVRGVFDRSYYRLILLVSPVQLYAIVLHGDGRRSVRKNTRASGTLHLV